MHRQERIELDLGIDEENKRIVEEERERTRSIVKELNSCTPSYRFALRNDLS